MLKTNKRWYVVSYDVRDPKRLRRVAKHLAGYGVRLQYSLFRCRLAKREMERLRWELFQLLAPEDDLLIIGLCPTCAQQVIKTGNQEGWSNEAGVSFEII